MIYLLSSLLSLFLIIFFLIFSYLNLLFIQIFYPLFAIHLPIYVNINFFLSLIMFIWSLASLFPLVSFTCCFFHFLYTLFFSPLSIVEFPLYMVLFCSQGTLTFLHHSCLFCSNVNVVPLLSIFMTLINSLGSSIWYFLYFSAFFKYGLFPLALILLFQYLLLVFITYYHLFHFSLLRFELFLLYFFL